jgi:hypothetical protein
MGFFFCSTLGVKFPIPDLLLLVWDEFLYLVARTADNGGEDGTRGVISGESSLAHTGSVVHNQSRNIVVTHVDELSLGGEWTGKNCKKKQNTQNEDKLDQTKKK